MFQALNCLVNVCGDIHIVIPTVVMFEMVPATILTFHEYQCLCVFGRNFYSVIYAVVLILIMLPPFLHLKLMFNFSCTCKIVIINK